MRNHDNDVRTSISTLHVALIGHIDHGKSTLAGRVLHELGLVSEDVIAEYKEQAALLGKSTFEYAWVMDTVKEERRIGLTIQPSYKLLEVNTKRIVLIDGPGHYKYTQNTILAIACADAAILLIAADDGIMVQTKEHATLAYALGIKDLIVVINKMDKIYPPYNHERFDELEIETTFLLTDIGFSSSRISILPAAAYFGENLTSPSSQMKWYSGQTVYEALSHLSTPELPIELPFRMAVDKVITKRGIGQIATGRIASGTISQGDKCVVVPGKHRAKVRSMEIFRKSVSSVFAGDDIGIALTGIGHNEIGRGSVIGSVDDPPSLAKVILAKVTVLEDNPGLREGRLPLLFAHSAHSVAKLLGIVSRVSVTTDEVLERKPSVLKQNETGYVEMELVPPLVLERRDKIPRFSKFILREQDRTVAVGSCIDLLESL